ncbi:hypothetical protein HHI36_015814 [Cryptolaemus montrouzieri]|uniref:PDZ domain-containing protein n=1 Tax=Cryptolaemus montrouzieri TaxID=559131 RepID=A0ABD2N6K7_9CUCU
MSVTDSAIKDLKACTHKFLKEKSGKIDDNHRYLSSFCQKLENIFYTGLKNATKYFTKGEEPYDWMLEISRDKNWKFSFHYVNSLYEIQRNTYLKSKLGKFRLLLRYCLVYKCLQVPVDYLLKNKKSCKYYQENSILGDEILSEILLSVFLQCGTIKFELDLSNTYFLETTWLLPDVLNVELVPSESLGISVTFSDEKAVVVKVDPHGVAAECGKIEVGDILESINGIRVDSSSRGKLNCLVRKQKSPFVLTIIKALKESSDNTLFIPLRKYLLDVNLDILSIQSKRKMVENEDDSKETVRDGFRCIFITSIRLGMEGDCRQIDRTIRDIMKYKYHIGEKQVPRYNKHVYIQLGELAVKIVDPETGKIMFSHAYMDISSCGPSSMYYDYFGYMKGNDKNDPGFFTCFIFYNNNKEDLDLILCSIGQGFKRTTFAV